MWNPFRWLKRAAVVVAGTFVRIFGSDKAHAFAAAALALIDSELGTIVTAVVTELDAQRLPNADKKATALRRVAEIALSAGILVERRTIDALIELVIGKLRGDFGHA